MSGMVWGVKNGDLNAVTGLVESDVSYLSIYHELLRFITNIIYHEFIKIRGACLAILLFLDLFLIALYIKYRHPVCLSICTEIEL